MQFAFLIGMIIVGLYYTASAAARSWAARLRLCSLGPPTDDPGYPGMSASCWEHDRPRLC